jgi:hypothetical protein
MRDKIITALLEGVTTVSFTKMDGERRDMQCTLNAELLPPIVETVETADVKPVRKVNPDVQRVWDTDKQAWRSFNWTRVITDE